MRILLYLFIERNNYHLIFDFVLRLKNNRRPTLIMISKYNSNDSNKYLIFGENA